MSARSRPPKRAPGSRSSSGAGAVWLIALLVALVATIQLRSQAEVERSLQSADPATLAFSIDELHRANDSLEAQINALQQRQSALQSGGTNAVDQELMNERQQLRMLEGLVAVQGPGVAFVLDAIGLTALDLQDALNNFAAGGAEAMAVNGHRVVVGVAIKQTDAGVTIGGDVVSGPWTILVIGDSTRLGETADLMVKQLRGDRRVRQASYSVESDVVINAVVIERPYVYAVPQ